MCLSRLPSTAAISSTAALIIPKSDTLTIGKIREAVEQAKQEEIPKWGGKLPPYLKLPLRDGDVDRPDDPAYVNSYFINTTSQEQPGVVDRKKVKITDPLAIYSGCYICASINIYPYCQSETFESFMKIACCRKPASQHPANRRTLKARVGRELHPAISEDRLASDVWHAQPTGS